MGEHVAKDHQRADARRVVALMAVSASHREVVFTGDGDRRGLLVEREGGRGVGNVHRRSISSSPAVASFAG